MVELSISACERLIKKGGGERVSKEAAEELAKILEEIGVDISKQASTMALHAKRKTVKADDIRLASKI
ncbi:Archaeal histone HAN1 subunit A [uncultured archaeon]|nr:Archaeal histone HAN1 subunit A [uncultured archaeon]